jgi:transposase
MQWFLEMLEELGIECRVGHPAKIRQAETRKQKHDRRDARLLLTLLAENRFPTIWMPSTEQRDLRTLLRHRHQWVRLRSRVQHTCNRWHSITVSGEGTRYGAKRASTHCGRCL